MAPTGKKVNYVEEISSLSDKVDAIMNMILSGHGVVDPNNIPLASLVAHDDNNVDVNFIKIITSTTMLIGTTLVTPTIDHIPLIMVIVTPTTVIKVYLLNFKSCSKAILVHKLLLTNLLRKILVK